MGAFKFIDLDKNNFIGAGEIRHILICMGELITDEEVDEMMRMCDRDGDGQISFEEFRRLIIHPDPGSPAFGKEEIDEPKSIAEKTEILSEGDRQRDAAIKQEKKVRL